MSLALTRMFALFTLAAYLLIGSVAVRVLMPETTTVTLSNNIFSLFSKTTILESEVEEIKSPEIKIAAIKFPVEKKVVVAKKVIIVKKIAPKAEMVTMTVERNELPFGEPVVLRPIKFESSLTNNLIALYKEFSYEMVVEASKPIEDEVSTKLAKSKSPVTITEEENDLSFFEYNAEEKAESKVNEEASVAKTPEEEVSGAQKINEVTEEVAVNDLIAFDYSKAKEDIKKESVPKVGAVTTQTGVAKPVQVSSTIVQEVAPPVQIPTTVSTQTSHANSYSSSKKQNERVEKKSLVPGTYYSNVTIQMAGTDLKATKNILGFEVRFQDDLSDALSDYNSGSAKLEQELSQPRMTRAVSLIKHGFQTTNTELIIEEGGSEVSIPAIEEEKFNDLIAPYESLGAVGVVLVELDDKIEGSSLDVPYGKVIHLNGDLRPTQDGDYRYQLFVGVKAGNTFLSYKKGDGEVISKIIHVHERELTYDAFYTEDVTNEKLKLFEEDLLAKEKAPLIIASEQVIQFATDKAAKKINSNTYKMNFSKALLGARRYLQLNHQDEPIFVGIKANYKVSVPSENFMRYILSRFEGGKLGNRCLVQVNLTKKASKIDVNAESADQLNVYTQVLDADGRFYDSVSDKSRKIIVVGESSGDPKLSQDAKINFKITYQNGSVEFVGSYCSPNSYLVEQL